MALRRRSRSRARRSSHSRRGLAVPAIQIVVILLCVAAGYVYWVDSNLFTRIANAHWSLPARLYAAPGDVYSGQALEPAGLERALIRSGYHSVGAPNRPGEYRRDGQAIEVYCRRFTYWDGTEIERRVRIDFAGGRVAGVRALPSGETLPIIRVDPPLIGRIYPQGDEDRVYVPYAASPRPLIDALVAAEDQRFFSHSGMDVIGIARAAWLDLLHADLAQGGSTLTQQLVKNLFLTNERSLSRKVNEIVMALLLERHYSKEQILEAYINEVYLGQHGLRAIRGFGAASEYYFGRPLGELSVEQWATLVGIVRGASYYNPWRNPARVLARRDFVLARMQDEGFLDAQQAAAARSRPLGVTPKPGWTQARYPAAVDAIRRQLQRDYRGGDLRDAGLIIFTTIDAGLQELAASATSRELAKLERERGLPNGTLEAASVLVRVSTGDILAAVGGRAEGAGEFNRSVDARRPIGSLIKPFIYLTALSDPAHYNVLTVLDDSPLVLEQPGGGEWRPKNYDAVAHGDVTMMEALVDSYNLATVRLGLDLGLDRVIQTLRLAGLARPVPALPSLLLGAVELTPTEVAQIYQSLANGGFSARLNGIREVTSAAGRPLRRGDLTMHAVFDPGAVYLTEYLMEHVTSEGTARELGTWLRQSIRVAGKTGTTDEARDSWFAGYGDGMLGVTWVGRDDNRPIGLSGATGAMRVWAELMRNAGLKALNPVPPANVGILDEARIRFAGACRTLRAVPYITPNPPVGGVGC